MLQYYGLWKCCPNTAAPVSGSESCCCCEDGGICPTTKPRRQPRACPKAAPVQQQQIPGQGQGMASHGGYASVDGGAHAHEATAGSSPVQTETRANYTVWQAKRVCNGALIGFRKNGAAYAMVLEKWVQCALDPSCIIPKGSSRMNHRQDQSALSVLVDRAFGLGTPPNHDGSSAHGTVTGGACSVGAVGLAGVALHKDESLSADECNELVGRRLPKHKHVWY